MTVPLIKKKTEKNRLLQPFHIHDFGISIAMLLEGVNSGQSCIQCCDLTWNVGTTAFRKLKVVNREIRSQTSLYYLYIIK